MAGEKVLVRQTRMEGEEKGKRARCPMPPTALYFVISLSLQKEAMWAAGKVVVGKGAYSGKAPPDSTRVPTQWVGLFSAWTAAVSPWSLAVHKCQSIITSEAYSLAYLAKTISCSH